MCLCVCFEAKHQQILTKMADQCRTTEVAPLSALPLIVRASTRVVVVMVVVRELFSLLMSAICVQIRGQGQRLRLFTT